MQEPCNLRNGTRGVALGAVDHAHILHCMVRIPTAGSEAGVNAGTAQISALHSPKHEKIPA